MRKRVVHLDTNSACNDGPMVLWRLSPRGTPRAAGRAALSGRDNWLTGTSEAMYSYGDATFLGAPTATHFAAALTGIPAPPYS
jgi:hypothetical protein